MSEILTDSVRNCKTQSNFFWEIDLPIYSFTLNDIFNLKVNEAKCASQIYNLSKKRS